LKGLITFRDLPFGSFLIEVQYNIPKYLNPFFDFGPNLTGQNWMFFWALCENGYKIATKRLIIEHKFRSPGPGRLSNGL
jgi:hypothetical protein